jgi:prolyl 4-hydroxylase
MIQDILEAHRKEVQQEATQFIQANFSGANLAGANFSGANLAGANFVGAHLNGANLNGANFTGGTIQEAQVYPDNQAVFPGGNLVAPPLIPSTEAVYNIQAKVLSWEPRVFLFEQFLQEFECDHLIQLAQPLMKPSSVVNSETGAAYVDEVRTSKGCFLFANQHKEDGILKSIYQRLAMVTQIPETNAQSFQILHYDVGQKYLPHFDAYDPQLPTYNKLMERGGQRFLTVLLYLNTPEQGGETEFPKVQLKVPAVKGNALVFFSCLPDGTMDPLSLHGGCPVEVGDKWVATRWMHMREFV